VPGWGLPHSFKGPCKTFFYLERKSGEMLLDARPLHNIRSSRLLVVVWISS